MKTITLKQEQEFISNCKKLYPIVYHSKTTVWPLREFFKLQDYKRNLKNFIKQTIFFFKNRESLPKNKLKILICPDGGIGDIVLSRLFVYKIKQILPDSFISVGFKNKKVLEMLYSNQNLADLITTNAYKNDYDLIYSGMRLYTLEVKNKNNISKYAQNFLPILQNAIRRQEHFTVFKNTPCSLEFPQIKSVLKLGLNAREANFWLNGFDDVTPNVPPYFLDKDKEQNTLKKFNLQNKKYIIIHDGFDNNLPDMATRNKKCWPKQHWEDFIKLFKQNYPDILVVQLGAKHSKTFEGIDISLIDKTPLTDLPYILNNSLLHIDGESGLVHITAALKKPALVIAGPSSPEYFLYEDNINILSRNCGNCLNIKNTWQSVCMLKQNPDCMTSVLPKRIFNATKMFLEGHSVKEILEEDLKENPINQIYQTNFTKLMQLCEKNLPYAKTTSKLIPQNWVNAIVDIISKPSEKFF